MLRLAAATDPAWTGLALAHLDEVLLDHAHLEKKAAGAAVTLLFRYPERRALQEPLSRLAREELAHFEEVLAHLQWMVNRCGLQALPHAVLFSRRRFKQRGAVYFREKE